MERVGVDRVGESGRGSHREWERGWEWEKERMR